MAVRFLGATSASGVGASISVPTPAYGSLRRGDFLIAFVVVQNYVGVVLTPPSGWDMEPSPPTIGDQIAFSALRYVVDSEDVSTADVFLYGSSRPFTVVAAAYRGVVEDVAYDPVNYPEGYFAPSGSGNVVRAQASVGTVSTPASGAGALVPWSRAVILFGATHGSAKPLLSDVSPAAAMRVKVETTKVSAMLCDVLEPSIVGTLPSWSSLASVTLSGAIGATKVLEPREPKDDSLDSYKAKLMRRIMPPPYDARWGTKCGNLLTTVGGSDNDVGGLFGVADFLPDEVP